MRDLHENVLGNFQEIVQRREQVLWVRFSTTGRFSLPVHLPPDRVSSVLNGSTGLIALANAGRERAGKRVGLAQGRLEGNLSKFPLVVGCNNTVTDTDCTYNLY